MNQIERGFKAFRKEAGERIAQLEAENAALREKDEDWENAVLHAREYRCDEKHCSCVIPLIGKLNQLERDMAALRKDSARLDWLISSIDCAFQLPAEQATESRAAVDAWRAAIDAAREEAQP